MCERWTAPLVLAIMAGVFSGCCPSTSQVIEMRSEVPPTAEETQKLFAKLLQFFETNHTRDACWRVETMATLMALDARLELASRDAQSHARLISALKEEYAHPRFQSTSRDGREDWSQIKAWAIYNLGMLQDPQLAGTFVSVLTTTGDADDPMFCARVAALAALRVIDEEVVRDTGLRRRMLCMLPQLRAAVGKVASSADSVVAARDYIAYFEVRLIVYPAVVDLLPAPNNSEMADDMLMTALEWNYQRLVRRDHEKPANQAAYAENVQKLLALAWDNRRAVRTRARIILSLFEPLPLFGWVTDRAELKQANVPEDYELMANLLQTADSVAEKTPEFPFVRKRALDILFHDIGAIPPDSRELIFARLYVHDPKALSHYLMAIVPGHISADDQKVLQVLRYLGMLLLGGSSKLDMRSRPLLASAIASFVENSAPSVRRQVVALLFDSYHDTLAIHLGRVLNAVDKEDFEGADYVVTSYLGCLSRCEEKNKRSMPYPGEILAALGAHPYEMCSRAIARPEMSIKRKAAAFLAPRDPSLLVRLLCADIAAMQARKRRIPSMELSMLGDTMQGKRDRIDAASLSVGSTVLRKCMFESPEEDALLCCRYLIEMGEAIPPEKCRQMPLACQTLVLAATTGQTASNPGAKGGTGQ